MPTLSRLYCLLIKASYPDPLHFRHSWEQELGIQLTDEDWTKAYTLSHTLSSAASLQGQNYKLLSRWYRCPTDIRRFDPSASDMCWCCKSSRGTPSHIWHGCTTLTSFCEKVIQAYNVARGSDARLDPRITILFILSGSPERSGRTFYDILCCLPKRS